MSIPQKVTETNDQIKDGFRKVNETIDNIVTGLTYTISSNTITLHKLNNDTVSTNIKAGLIKDTVYTSFASNVSAASFPSGVTFNYTIDLAKNDGTYFMLDNLGAYTNTVPININISLIDRNIDGGAFLLKVKTYDQTGGYDGSPLISISVTGDTLDKKLIPNNLYLFSYQPLLTTKWVYDVVQEGDYTLKTDTDYANIFYDGTFFSTSLTITTTGKIFINGKYLARNSTKPLVLPKISNFPYKELEIFNFGTNGTNPSNRLDMRIIADPSSDFIFGSNKQIPSLITNELSNNYIKLINNGVNKWYVISPSTIYNNAHLEKTPTIYNLSQPVTAYTSNNYGYYKVNNGVCDYNFSLILTDISGSSLTTTFYLNTPIISSDVSSSMNNAIMYPIMIQGNTGSTTTIYGSVEYQGSNGSFIKFYNDIKQTTPINYTYFSNNLPYKITGNISYVTYNTSYNLGNTLLESYQYPQL